jgi:hypothetical protein
MKNRRWLFRIPSDQAESTSTPAMGKMIRTRLMVRSRCSPSKPGVNTVTRTGASNAPASASPRHREQEGEHRARQPTRVRLPPVLQQLGVLRDERRAQRPFAQQVLEHVRHPDRRPPRVRRDGGAEVPGEDHLPDQPGDPAQKDARCHPLGGAGRAARPPARQPSSPRAGAPGAAPRAAGPRTPSAPGAAPAPGPAAPPPFQRRQALMRNAPSSTRRASARPSWESSTTASSGIMRTRTKKSHIMAGS